MVVMTDLYGYRFDNSIPSFIEFTLGNPYEQVNEPKFYYHRPTKRLLDIDEVEADRIRLNYTWKQGEVGRADEWLFPNTGYGVNMDEPEHELTWREAVALRMHWMGKWDEDVTYAANDVVTDNNWLAVALVDAPAHRPAPLENGLTEWLVDNSGGWNNMPDVAASVSVGVRYTAEFPVKVTRLRAWMRTGYIYNVYYVQDASGPLSTWQVQLILAKTTVAADGWVSIGLPTSIYNTGKMFGVVVTISVDPESTTPISFSGKWDYQKPGAPQPPNSGQALHAGDAAGQIFFHEIDSDGNNRSEDLATVQSGGTISGAGSVWTIVSVADAGNYEAVGVTPAVQASATGKKDFLFEIPVTSLLSHVYLPSYYLNTPNIRGIISTNGFTNGSLNDNAYGVDIELTPVSYSDQWDLLAYSGATNGVDTASMTINEIKSQLETAIQTLSARVEALENGD